MEHDPHSTSRCMSDISEIKRVGVEVDYVDNSEIYKVSKIFIF